jgi:hypothetical protein
LDDHDRESGGHIGDIFGDQSAVDDFFKPSPPRRALRRPAKARPEHYKVISISLYLEDIERLEELVQALKAQGHTRASRSMLIREALRQIDLDKVPPQR